MNQIMVLASLFLVILFGFLAYKFKIMSDQAAQSFNKLIFYFCAPAIIFSSLVSIDRGQLSSYPLFILINVSVLWSFSIVGFQILRLLDIKREIRGSLLYTSISGNLVYFAYPILLFLFPKEHFSLGVVYSVIGTALGGLATLFLLGLDKHSKIFDLKKNLSEFARNPIVISSVFGFLFLFFNIPLPKLLTDALDILGKPTATLGLFSMGIYFAHNFGFKKINLSLIPSLIKLVVLPLVVYLLVFKIIRLDLAAAQTSVIMAAMPSAVFSIVVSDVYDLDKTLTSNTVILSSILFLFTSTFWIWLITL